MEALCACPEHSGRTTFWKGKSVRWASLKIQVLCPNIQIWSVHPSASVLGKHYVKALCYYVHALNVQAAPDCLRIRIIMCDRRH